jgi:hypothetical protein
VLVLALMLVEITAVQAAVVVTRAADQQLELVLLIKAKMAGQVEMIPELRAQVAVELMPLLHHPELDH